MVTLRVLCIETKIRKLNCITQGFALGSKGLQKMYCYGEKQIFLSITLSQGEFNLKLHTKCIKCKLLIECKTNAIETKFLNCIHLSQSKKHQTIVFGAEINFELGKFILK